MRWLVDEATPKSNLRLQENQPFLWPSTSSALHRRKWLEDIPVPTFFWWHHRIRVLPKPSQKQKISSMTKVCSCYWTNDLAGVSGAAKRQILMFCMCYACCSSVIMSIAVEMLDNAQWQKWDIPNTLLAEIKSSSCFWSPKQRSATVPDSSRGVSRTQYSPHPWILSFPKFWNLVLVNTLKNFNQSTPPLLKLGFLS